MAANAHGIVKAGGEKIAISIKNASEAKINSWDNMPERKIDDFEKTAKELLTSTLRDLLKTYYKDDQEKCKLIKDMPKGVNADEPNCLLNMIVPYWRSNFEAPPVFLKAPKKDKLQIEALKLKVPELKKQLIDYYTGKDDNKCNKINNAKKGDFSSPDSLVSMTVELWKLIHFDPSL